MENHCFTQFPKDKRHHPLFYSCFINIQAVSWKELRWNQQNKRGISESQFTSHKLMNTIRDLFVEVFRHVVPVFTYWRLQWIAFNFKRVSRRVTTVRRWLGVALQACLKWWLTDASSTKYHTKSKSIFNIIKPPLSLFNFNFVYTGRPLHQSCGWIFYFYRVGSTKNWL